MKAQKGSAALAVVIALSILVILVFMIRSSKKARHEEQKSTLTDENGQSFGDWLLKGQEPTLTPMQNDLQRYESACRSKGGVPVHSQGAVNCWSNIMSGYVDVQI